MSRKKRILLDCLILLFIGIIIFSGYKIWKITEVYRDEEKVHNKTLEYRPYEQSDVTDDTGDENPTVSELMAKYPDAVGWLRVPGTMVDYPIVHYSDNDWYLTHDIDGNYAASGSIFMDYRCERNFTSQNTIIYGHHMLNESVFGTLEYFNDEAFFTENRSAFIYLPDKTLELEIFAYTVLNPDTEKEIYNVRLSGTYFDYIRENARYYRDIGINENDRIVTLSTCAYEFDNARMVLISKIKN